MANSTVTPALLPIENKTVVTLFPAALFSRRSDSGGGAKTSYHAGKNIEGVGGWERGG